MNDAAISEFEPVAPHHSHTSSGTETRNRILETALSLMWSRSFGAVSVDDICRQAGVKKGSFYHFFPSKSKLTIEALDLESARFGKILTEILKSPDPVLKRFSNLCELAITIQREKAKELGHISGCPLCSVGSELSGNDNDLRKAILALSERPIKLYEAAIAEAVTLGEIPSCDPAVKARQLQTFIAGSMFEARLKNDLGPLFQLEAGIMALLGIVASNQSVSCPR